MRLLVTADLHFNHRRSRPLAEDLIARMNAAGGDGVLVVGDTAAGDGHHLEECLSLFNIRGPRLFVAGNHELWTRESDSRTLLETSLPRRVREVGWHWLEDDPVTIDGTAIVGSVGWYDYSFAVPELQIPERYYAGKVSPGVARRLSEFSHLIAGDESVHATEIVARWNDGKFVSLGLTDAEFLAGRIASLRRQLKGLRQVRQVVAAVHHVPFPQLLPPRHGAQWDFARAYLGSGAIGALLREYENLRTVICGHSHWPAEVRVGRLRAINIGSGYREKHFVALELDD